LMDDFLKRIFKRGVSAPKVKSEQAAPAATAERSG
jgi:hypothetical protein